MKQGYQNPLLAQEAQHDACGIGCVVSISGQKTRRTVDDALKIVEKLAHRTGKDADGTTGDGVGIMTQLRMRCLNGQRSRQEKSFRRRGITALP